MNPRTTIRFDVYTKAPNDYDGAWYLYAAGYVIRENAEEVAGKLYARDKKSKVVQRTIVETSVDVYP